MSDYYLDTKNIQNRFSIRVDWDIDPYGSIGGCHGRDLFFDDDPQEIPFSVFKNGDVVIKWGDHFVDENYILKKDGTLLQFHFKNLWSVFLGSMKSRPPKSLPQAFTPTVGDRAGPYYEIAYVANETFYRCYHGSGNFNQHLTDHQKAIVERFFTAARQAFPQEFARK